MQIKNFNSVLKELQPFLSEYLQSKGLDTTKNFSCIDPKHEDKKPSCSLMKPDNIRAFCHSCNRIFDIFDSVCLLENKPMNGIGFVTEVLQYLASKYNIPLEMGEISEEKLFELQVYRAYRDVADYITDSVYQNTLSVKEITRRAWGKPIIHETQTGSICNHDEYLKYLINKGYDREFLAEADLLRNDIFEYCNLIFTTHDEYGNPVGFAARNLLFDKNNPASGQKYVNQKTSGIKANIYRKSERLFGFHLARQNEGPIYIFEGQASVLTARQAGLLTCCAIGSTALTTEHVMLLKEFNKFNVVLCLDGDEAGQDKIAKLLDTRFAGHKEMRVSIIFIPNGQDPDDFIREKGIAEFHKLAKHSAFAWRLQRFTDHSDPIDICTSMIPYIVNESSYLVQEDMAKILSAATGYSVQAINFEVERLQNAFENKKSLERISVIEQALMDAKNNPVDGEIILTEAKNKLVEISKKYDDDGMSEGEFLAQVISQRAMEEAKNDKYSGFVLSEDMQYFQEVLSGQWNQDVLLVIAGSANTGKTSLTCKLGYDIASHEEENDAIVIVHTIDDSRDQVLPKFISLAEGSKKLTLNAIKDPNYWQTQNSNINEMRKIGYDKVEELIKHGRLIVKDSAHGTSLSYVETLIEYYREKYPNRKLVYCLDNFHKLSDFSDKKEERVRFKKLSSSIKKLAVTYHIPIISTMEYTKLAPGQVPNNNSLSESVAMQYDSNLILHLFNALHDMPTKSVRYHTTEEEPNRRLPIIEMIFGKNKISGFKDSLWFKFFPASSDFSGLSIEEVITLTKLAETKQATQTQPHE